MAGYFQIVRRFLLSSIRRWKLSIMHNSSNYTQNSLLLQCGGAVEYKKCFMPRKRTFNTNTLIYIAPACRMTSEARLYNSVADNTGLSSSLAVFASQVCEMTRNSEIIRTYSSSRSSKVIDLGANRKCVCNFLLAISSNFGHRPYLVPFSIYWRITLENSLFSPHHPCLIRTR